MRLEINSELHLSPPMETDIPRYVEFFQDKTIYDHTLTIPYPYTEQDAKNFIGMVHESEKKAGEALQFAIRNTNGELMGGIGYHGKNIFDAVKHKDEIGYWLAKPYRGNGLMQLALNRMIDHGKNVRLLTRIEAPVCAGNIASEKTLLNCGFQREGVMKNAYKKNGVFIDGIMLALVF